MSSQQKHDNELLIKALTSLRLPQSEVDVQALAAFSDLERLVGSPPRGVEGNDGKQQQSPLVSTIDLSNQTTEARPNLLASALVWSAAKVQMLRFFQQIRNASIDKLDEYSDDELNHLVLTLGAARIKDDELFAAIGKQIVGRLDAAMVDNVNNTNTNDDDGDLSSLLPTGISLSMVALTFVMNQVLDQRVLDTIARCARRFYDASLHRPSADVFLADGELLSLAWSFVAARTLDKKLLSPAIKDFFELSSSLTMPPAMPTGSRPPQTTTTTTTGSRQQQAQTTTTPPSPQRLFDRSPPEQLHEACLAWRMSVSPVLPPLLQSLITPDWFSKFKERCEDFALQPAKLRASGRKHPLFDVTDYLDGKGHRGYKHNFITPRGLFADLFVGGRTIVSFLSSKDDLLSDRKTMTGLKRFRGKLLTMEGFRVIELNQYEWNKMSVVERHRLLDQVILSAVGK